MKVAIYARYSSENQRDASIADQFRICREFALRQGWQIANEYSDHAVSGATLLRSGFQAMMASALRKEVDVVLAESLDRFSRDQEDTAGIFKDYMAGASPKQIAKALNAEGVRGPRGALWSPSTIHGNPERGIGILHNELYIGRLVWNRQRFLKDPDTGKRVARTNPPSERI